MNLIVSQKLTSYWSALNLKGITECYDGNSTNECYSRKIFVGGVPTDIDENEITSSFKQFGSFTIYWPRKRLPKLVIKPKGYVFLVFEYESSIHEIIKACINVEGQLYHCVSSSTIKDKLVQIRPWKLCDANFVVDTLPAFDPRKTIFIGGLPRTLKAIDLATAISSLYGGVCYAGIDIDEELKYPKGVGHVAFSNQQSYMAALSTRFIQFRFDKADKFAEMKPFVLEDQMCSECKLTGNSGTIAPYFCPNIKCLQYYCEQCWGRIHAYPERALHLPLVKEGVERPRVVPLLLHD